MTLHNDQENWERLPVSARAELLKAGIPFPSETTAERRCRVKAKLGLMDDDDLKALADVSDDTLARRRVNGTGPRPIRVMRAVFYAADDVRDWMLRHRDAVIEKKGRA